MKNKVYVQDLTIEEILIRLDKGDIIYNSFCKDLSYKKIDGIIIRFDEGRPTDLNNRITLDNDSYYFLDEVDEEPKDTEETEEHKDNCPINEIDILRQQIIEKDNQILHLKNKNLALLDQIFNIHAVQSYPIKRDDKI